MMLHQHAFRALYHFASGEIVLGFFQFVAQAIHVTEAGNGCVDEGLDPFGG